MPSTTNFGWTTPADTDLVKDGASAIRTLGNGIDTSFVDLKGGTTGQVLAKATNADLDFTWTNGGDITNVIAGTGISGGGTSGDVTITNSMATAIDAKGDLIAGTGADTFSRLAIGSNDQVLTADSAAATGMKWAALPAGGGMTLLSTTSISGSSTTVSSISQDYTDLVVIISNYVYGTGASSIQMGLDGAGDSLNYQVNIYGTTSFAGAVSGYPNGYIRPTYDVAHTNGQPFNCALTIRRYSTADTYKMWNYSAVFYNNTESALRGNFGGGGFASTSGIDSFTITNNQSRTATSGTIYIYGVK